MMMKMMTMPISRHTSVAKLAQTRNLFPSESIHEKIIVKRIHVLQRADCPIFISS